MNPLTYTEISVYSLWMYSIVFWYKWILSLIPKYLPVPILIRSIVFWYKWILSLIPKYLYFLVWIRFIVFRYKWILSFIPKYLHSLWICSLVFLHIHVYIFFWIHTITIRYKWILSLILRCLHIPIWIPILYFGIRESFHLYQISTCSYLGYCCVIFCCKWILSLTPQYLFFHSLSWHSLSAVSFPSYLVIMYW
jgi:hypothetical protein